MQKQLTLIGIVVLVVLLVVLGWVYRREVATLVGGEPNPLDANRDGEITDADVQTFVKAYQNPDSDENIRVADFDNNGEVTIEDLAAFTSAYRNQPN